MPENARYPVGGYEQAVHAAINTVRAAGPAGARVDDPELFSAFFQRIYSKNTSFNRWWYLLLYISNNINNTIGLTGFSAVWFKISNVRNLIRFTAFFLHKMIFDVTISIENLGK